MYPNHYKHQSTYFGYIIIIKLEYMHKKNSSNIHDPLNDEQLIDQLMNCNLQRKYEKEADQWMNVLIRW